MKSQGRREKKKGAKHAQKKKKIFLFFLPIKVRRTRVIKKSPSLLCAVRCVAQFAASRTSLLRVVRCFAQFAALRSSLLCAVRRFAQFAALRSSLPCAVRCLAQLAALRSLLPCGIKLRTAARNEISAEAEKTQHCPTRPRNRCLFQGITIAAWAPTRA